MMTRAAWVGVIVGVAVLIGLFAWVYYEEEVPPPYVPTVAEPLPAEDPVAEPEAEPAIAHPMPEPAADSVPLPELENSDDSALADARKLFGSEFVAELLIPRELIRRSVLFVDSLDREALPMWLRPVRRIPGTFETVKQDETMRIAADNAQRYAPVLAVVDRIDMAALVATYRKLYPLFQDAYARIGNPRARYFNDRLIQIIDHLLETPVVDEPIALVRPKVLYLYADAELEALSSGQKALLRMGRDNAARVQARLREFRSAIATRPAS
jgi:hypothetical protein